MTWLFQDIGKKNSNWFIHNLKYAINAARYFWDGNPESPARFGYETENVMYIGRAIMTSQ